LNLKISQNEPEWKSIHWMNKPIRLGMLQKL